jgi:hypothetical protein
LISDPIPVNCLARLFFIESFLFENSYFALSPEIKLSIGFDKDCPLLKVDKFLFIITGDYSKSFI